MSAREAAQEFEQARGALARQWADAREQWPDQLGGNFEAQHWSEIEADGRALAETLRDLADVLDAAREAVS